MNSNSADMPASGPDAVTNRRGDERVPSRFEVRFHRTQDAAKALRAYSLNISAGGLCLRTRKAYDVGCPVLMNMVIAGEAFQIHGIIAWVRDESEAIGVRFTNMTEEERSRLQRVIDSIPR